MFENLRIHVILPCLNEEKKIIPAIQRIQETGFADEIIVVDDGSTDDSIALCRKAGAHVIELGATLGVGKALLTGFQYSRSRCDVIVVMAGNNKDEPKEISRLLAPIVAGKAIFVQGSRYLPGGAAGGPMPLYRKFATLLHPWLFSLCSGRKVTESTNGFRAFKVELLSDSRIHLDQSWLHEYELEPYLLYKVATLDYPLAEVPVSKTYPPKHLGYTKMPAITGWWSILRPLFLLRLGLRH